MAMIDNYFGNIPKKEPLERFRTFRLVFDKPLPSLILKGLLEEKAFISKYSRINIAKLDHEIQALIITDNSNINYVLNYEGIQAQSAFIDNPKKIIESLKSMGDLIIKLYDLDFNYILNNGADFRYIENYNLLNELNDAKLTKKLRKKFGNNISAVQCKYVLKTKKGDEIINIAYPRSNDLKNKRVLIEASEEYIERLYEVLKND